MSRHFFSFAVVQAMALTLVLQSSLKSEQAPSAEYQLKAVFLYHFTRYVSWPNLDSTEEAPIVIATLGPNPFGSLLEEVVRGERVNGRPLAVRHFADIDQVEACHVLFISADVDMPSLPAAWQQQHILTVGERPGFAEGGGTINFFVDDARLRYEINIEAVSESRLVVSSKLLKLARIVGSRKDASR